MDAKRTRYLLHVIITGQTPLVMDYAGEIQELIDTGYLWVETQGKYVQRYWLTQAGEELLYGKQG